MQLDGTDVTVANDKNCRVPYVILAYGLTATYQNSKLDQRSRNLSTCPLPPLFNKTRSNT